jgi:ketosteroid isomerase-like protein
MTKVILVLFSSLLLVHCAAPLPVAPIDSEDSALSAASHITVAPASKGYFVRKGDQTMMFMQRQNQAEEAEVREALEQFHAALNAIFTGEVTPMQAVWSHADDVTYMGPDGAYRMGWVEVLADWKAQAALNLGGSVAPDDVRTVAGRELAVVHNIVKGANVDVEGNSLDVSLRATVIFRQEDGAWKVIAVHTDLLPNLAN